MQENSNFRTGTSYITYEVSASGILTAQCSHLNNKIIQELQK